MFLYTPLYNVHTKTCTSTSAYVDLNLHVHARSCTFRVYCFVISSYFIAQASKENVVPAEKDHQRLNTTSLKRNAYQETSATTLKTPGSSTEQCLKPSQPSNQQHGKPPLDQSQRNLFQPQPQQSRPHAPVSTSTDVCSVDNHSDASTTSTSTASFWTLGQNTPKPNAAVHKSGHQQFWGKAELSAPINSSKTQRITAEQEAIRQYAGIDADDDVTPRATNSFRTAREQMV